MLLDLPVITDLPDVFDLPVAPEVLTLSGALRRGIELCPEQCFSTMFDLAGRACALGAIIKGAALSLPDVGGWYDAIVERFPAVANIVENPVTGYWQALNDAIWRLNDHAGWSREMIADWLESKGY